MGKYETECILVEIRLCEYKLNFSKGEENKRPI